eukprot:7081983-Pyramimonas_sp.AAC.1
MVFALIESLGVLPPQISVALLALLPKPSGGYRPIGVFCSWYRVWGRLRRPMALHWEQQHPRRYWAAGRHRGAADVVWRQSVQSEAG